MTSPTPKKDDGVQQPEEAIFAARMSVAASLCGEKQNAMAWAQTALDRSFAMIEEGNK